MNVNTLLAQSLILITLLDTTYLIVLHVLVTLLTILDEQKRVVKLGRLCVIMTFGNGKYYIKFLIVNFCY